MTNFYGRNLLPSTVGFDTLFSTLENIEKLAGTSNNRYPPHNVIKLNDFNYQIQIAVAGFSKDEINIETKENRLTISGSIPESKETSVEYLYHGLANRNFVRTFDLHPTVVVTSANIVNGVLIIDLERIIPEEQRPKKIPINVETQKLLTE